MSDSLHLPQAESAIDRDANRRQAPGLFADLARDPDTRVIAMYEGKVLINEDADSVGPRLIYLPSSAVPEFEFECYLGRTRETARDEGGGLLPTGVPLVLRILSADAAVALQPQCPRWHDLRRAIAALGTLDAEVWAQSLSLGNWHASVKFCSACGGKTKPVQAGWARRCGECKHMVFPRTDPAVIVAITDQHDRLLLGSQGTWEDNRWSVLAGYVEAGESLTAAVNREVFEESGLRLTEIEFVGSQPWPFPYSLMFGFRARADSNQPLMPDGEEIAKLRWISRSEFLVERERMLLPGPLSIARSLIDQWLHRELRNALQRRA